MGKLSVPNDNAMNMYGEVEVKRHAFLILALHGSDWSVRLNVTHSKS
jgi:hypothetical protein